MLFELLKDVTKMGLIVACLYLAIGAYARSKQPAWSGLLGKRRLAILFVLVLAVTVIKVGEDVLAEESGPVDEAILRVVRNHIHAMLTRFFEVITVTGSSTVLVPLASAATIALFLARRRHEALLLAASAISASILIYLIKMAVGRARPALWETQWYWGSSFSGAVAGALMDFPRGGVTFGTRRALANRRIDRCVHRRVHTLGNQYWV